MKPQRLLKLATFILVPVSLVIALWRIPVGGRGRPVTTGTVTSGDMIVKVTISGTVMPKRYANIAAPYNGYVQRLFVKIGDRVVAGAPVVSVAQAIGSGQEEVFPLRSPLTGVVAQVWKREGEYVTAGGSGPQGDGALVRIDDVSKLTVISNVPEVEIGKLKVGLPVLIRAVAVADRTYNGSISEIALAAREQSGGDRARVEFPLSITISDHDDRIRPGMSVVVDIIVNEVKGALMLPHEFVQRGPQGYFVTLASGERKNIQVGISNEESFEIKGGVSLGEKVQMVDFLAVGGEL
jgi:multidrug efflux pump subunit AcrA (membrane-fusion protein)